MHPNCEHTHDDIVQTVNKLASYGRSFKSVTNHLLIREISTTSTDAVSPPRPTSDLALIAAASLWNHLKKNEHSLLIAFIFLMSRKLQRRQTKETSVSIGSRKTPSRRVFNVSRYGQFIRDKCCTGFAWSWCCWLPDQTGDVSPSTRQRI